jgi:hypothetical protein
MKPSLSLFDRRGRELGLAARPRLDLARNECGQDKNQNKKPLTQISLQNRASRR